jgi:hypothetical protein
MKGNPGNPSWRETHLRQGLLSFCQARNGLGDKGSRNFLPPSRLTINHSLADLAGNTRIIIDHVGGRLRLGSIDIATKSSTFLRNRNGWRWIKRIDICGSRTLLRIIGITSWLFRCDTAD